MRDIRINLTLTDKINATLDSVQSGCSVRCLDADDLIAQYKRVIRGLDAAHCGKAERKGIVFSAGGGYKMPRSYGHPVVGTVAHLEFGSDGRCFLISVARTYCTNNDTVTLTEAAESSISVNSVWSAQKMLW